MDYRARFYSPSLGRFIQPDSLVPNPSNPQNLNHFSYVSNNPIRYIDPSGHCIWDGCTIEAIALTVAAVVIVSEGIGIVMFGTSADYHGINNAEQYVTNSGDAMSTYTAAGIAVQSNWEPLTDLTTASYNSGLGKAQVSQNQLDNELGMPGSDPFDPNVAVQAMQKRISLVTDLCNTGAEITCSSTDIFIAAALAQNAVFTRANMSNLINSKLRKEYDPNNPGQALLPWEELWFSQRDQKNRAYDKLILKLFKNDVEVLRDRNWHVPDDIDWDYIDNLSEGGWRSKLR